MMIVTMRSPHGCRALTRIYDVSPAAVSTCHWVGWAGKVQLKRRRKIVNLSLSWVKPKSSTKKKEPKSVNLSLGRVKRKSSTKKKRKSSTSHWVGQAGKVQLKTTERTFPKTTIHYFLTIQSFYAERYMPN